MSVSKFCFVAEVRERRSALDLASVRGKRMVWRVAKVSRARARGSTPLILMLISGWDLQEGVLYSQLKRTCNGHVSWLVLCKPQLLL